ncbi:MAG: hypothetical protein REI94_18560 [Moraxellaceae bacterium]|nr:hypothetical protein [Moraxellaceae bacterium]
MKLRILSAAAALLTFLALPATAQMVPLQEGDVSSACGCRFGSDAPGKPTLVFWSQEDKREAVLRTAKGVQKLSFYGEKYIPEQREVPRAGDRFTLQIANGDTNVQWLGTVTSSCSPKAKRCTGTSYKGRLVVLWDGKRREQMDAWGQCFCPAP